MMIAWKEGEWKIRLAIWIAARWKACCKVVRKADRKICKAVRSRQLIVVTGATVVAIVVTIRWQGIGGVIFANAANWAKDAGEIIAEIEIIVED